MIYDMKHLKFAAMKVFMSLFRVLRKSNFG